MRKRVNKWKHELTPPCRSSSVASSRSSSALSGASRTSSSSSLVSPAERGNTGRRSAGGTDVVPFLIPLARLARQLEIDTAAYTRRYVVQRPLRNRPEKLREMGGGRGTGATEYLSSACLGGRVLRISDLLNSSAAYIVTKYLTVTAGCCGRMVCRLEETQIIILNRKRYYYTYSPLFLGYSTSTPWLPNSLATTTCRKEVHTHLL